jgi:alpha-tubulin suppressor-like RCC1 family protein
MSIKIKNNTVIYDDEVFAISSNTTANRPISPSIGMLRFNTTTKTLEGFNGSAWKQAGTPPSSFIYSAGALPTRTCTGTVVTWCAIETGFIHRLLLRTDTGSAWAYGSGYCGALGDGTTTCRTSPVSVVGGFTDWCQLSGGQGFSMGLRSNGTIWTWGRNNEGQLGDETTVNKSSPVSVVGGFTDWCQISAGWVHSTAIRSNGSLWTWGSNGSGRLGDGTTTSRSSPVSVVGGISNWCQVSAGSGFTLGLTSAGIAWGWGENYDWGAVGNGTSFTRYSSPVQVAGGHTWKCLAAGERHSLGLRTDGVMMGWGLNICGESGVGFTGSIKSPSLVCSGITNWCQIAAGKDKSAAITASGQAWTWGDNSCGIGLGTTNSGGVTIPTAITNPNVEAWTRIAVGKVSNQTAIFGIKSC